MQAHSLSQERKLALEWKNETNEKEETDQYGGRTKL